MNGLKREQELKIATKSRNENTSVYVERQALNVLGTSYYSADKVDLILLQQWSPDI